MAPRSETQKRSRFWAERSSGRFPRRSSTASNSVKTSVDYSCDSTDFNQPCFLFQHYHVKAKYCSLNTIHNLMPLSNLIPVCLCTQHACVSHAENIPSNTITLYRILCIIWTLQYDKAMHFVMNFVTFTLCVDCTKGYYVQWKLLGVGSGHLLWSYR